MEQRLKSLLEKPVVRGLMGRCPKCGEGKMFRAFLKVADNCPVCGEELHHHRADDFPAYLVVVIVGHVIVAALLTSEIVFAPPFWLDILIWIPLTLLMAILLIQPMKGMVVAWQWQQGMDGFAAAKRAREGLAAT
ncbi:MAG: DUF983 domain-containing protein [Alphaproteobacteria bacterium]|nr:DUF983 domain-containing protein [Alphaproteobacteria bacterium]MBL6938043.1 DUF983 domain-containing protein [Alphaproteobacteria bacterium]MBL7099132.1 DUF983 domain-containing protein [Alphaproteobacteria bacterium]